MWKNQTIELQLSRQVNN